jgi:hypothetical protein
MANDDLNPRSGKRTIELPFRYLVKRADPDFEKDRVFEPEYEFGGGRRLMKGKRNQRGAYDGQHHSPPPDWDA